MPMGGHGCPNVGGNGRGSVRPAFRRSIQSRLPHKRRGGSLVPHRGFHGHIRLSGSVHPAYRVHRNRFRRHMERAFREEESRPPGGKERRAHMEERGRRRDSAVRHSSSKRGMADGACDVFRGVHIHHGSRRSRYDSVGDRRPRQERLSHHQLQESPPGHQRGRIPPGHVGIHGRIPGDSSSGMAHNGP